MDKALIISIIALLIAIPPAIQMLFGKPKIVLNFFEEDFKHTRILTCSILNKPINDSILKLLGIYRRSVVIMVSFQIFESGTNKVITDSLIPEILTYDGKKGQRAILEQSSIFVSVQLVRVKDGVVIRQELDEEDNSHTIPLGEYYVKLLLSTDNKTITEFRSFFVSDKYPYAGWKH